MKAMKPKSVTTIKEIMRFLAILLAVVISVASTFAQTPINTGVTPEIRQAADKAYQAKDWHKAADAYRVIVKLDEKNPGAHYRLGISLLGVEKNEDALRQLQIANQLSPNPVFALALARAHARMRNEVKMYEVLEASLAMGGISPASVEGETDFKDVRSQPRFVEFVKKCRLLAEPCTARPEYRQFDFWIGEWEVKNPQGLIAGTNSIHLILGTCIIFENWSGTSGTNGKSFNIYDTNDKKWHQTWVDDKGTFTHYMGGLQDGKMVVVANTLIAGKKTLAKMTFTKLPNGDVRQHGENSTDEGKTWTTVFDLTYVRKK